jgi:hypothetical protein
LKLNLKKDLIGFYSAKTEPAIVNVPSGSFLTIDGKGEPGGEAYQTALEALFTAAYTLKFQEKAKGRDFTVMMLEGLWWLDNPVASFEKVPREEWRWKSMVRQPDFVTDEMVIEAKAMALKRKRGGPRFDDVVLDKFYEGVSAQVMHRGPYSLVRESIERLERFIEENGYRRRGLYHEIYLNDPRRATPEKIKTIIRHPVEKRV